jgi:glycerol-3-phosphate acyltransferase PlsX
MRIVLDAMGSDTCPDPEIRAAIESARLFGDPIILVGPADQIQPDLKTLGAGDSVRLVDATDTITMEDKGLALALKAKRKNSKTSMAVGIDLVKNGEADAFVTAGNTGGAMATAFFRLGNLPGVERPALAGIFPVRGGTCVVLDIGANPECKPEHLVQFAVMGSVYASKVRGVSNPRVGLLSNGEEAGKGNQLVKDTYPLLEASGLNFIGNLEGKELFGGQADVAVTDGFTGNILLKSSEAVSRLLVDILREELLGSLRTKVGAALARPAFNKLRRMMDPAEVGAALLLGIDGVVFIGHGRSDARALVSAVRTARSIVASDLVNEINSAIQVRLSSTAETTTKEMA